MGNCFIGCGEMLNTMGKKCVDVEANGSEQSGKLASPLGSDSEMEVDEQSPDETQKSNSNNIECCERSNISFLDFLFEFCTNFIHQILVNFLCQNTKFVHFCNTQYHYFFYFKKFKSNLKNMSLALNPICLAKPTLICQMILTIQIFQESK